jgi:hypothetical protein
MKGSAMRALSRFVLASVLLLSLPLLSTTARADGDLRCPPDFRPPILVTISPAHPCAGDSVVVYFRSCSNCTKDFGVFEDSTGISVRSSMNFPSNCLTRACMPETASFSIGRVAAGHFTVSYRFVTALTVRSGDDGDDDGDHDLLDHHGGSGDSLVCVITHPEMLSFDVSRDCGSPGPGPGLPFVTSVQIGRPGPCATCPPVLCPGDSQAVVIHGAFPNSCYAFEGVEAVRPAASPLRAEPFEILSTPIPGVPALRLIYSHLDCKDSSCVAGTFPFDATVNIGTLPPRTAPYMLPIVAVQINSDCTGPHDTTMAGAAVFPFTVAASCSSTTGPACLLSKFDVAGRPGDDHRCDAFFGPGHPASVNFKTGSSVSLFGLQGEFKLDPPKLRVSDIQAIGPASGFHLNWTATDHGAKFVLFSDGKGRIPPVDPANLDSTLANILQVQVSPGTEDSGPGHSGDKGNVPKVKMVALNLLGADSLGHGVNPCPTITDEFRFDAFVVFCPGEGCDFNGDGSTDVRDLVAMVMCMRDSTLCPPGAIPPDCDGDSVFTVSDVMCCANEILNGDHGHGHGGEHHDASLRVSFGTPVSRGGLLEIPVTLDGNNPIGGARLAFNFPADRFTVRDVVFAGDPECLGLYQAGSGIVDVGLLEIGGVPAARGGRGAQSTGVKAVAGAGAAYHQFTLRLALKPGQTAGGDLSLSIADISDPNGTMLTGDLGTPIASLGSGGELMLAPARPNPFGRTMSFAVTMAHDGDLEVSIHDVSGRVVTSLHHGALAAGPHSFTWDGTRADGTRAANGIYFYRARANGQMVSSKVVLVREP